MYYLLIDNCSLLEMVKSEAYNEYLNGLENYLISGKIKLITHKLLLQEWDNHKIEKQKDKERNIRMRDKLLNSKLDSKKSKILDQTNKEINTIIHIEAQTKTIEKILRNSYVEYLDKTPEILIHEIGERLIENKAPFLNGKKSINDWLIFGSTALYCEKSGINQLCFISSNTNDYNKPGALPVEIHPSIQSRFKNVEIKYYRDYKDFFNYIQYEFSLVSEFDFLNINKAYTFNSSLKKTVSKSLKYIFDELYEEINFIPLHILMKYYPFASSEKKPGYYEKYTVSYVNENFVKYIEVFMENAKSNIETLNENSTKKFNELKDDYTYIFRCLNLNLINYLHNNPSSPNYTLTPPINIKCDCFKCCYHRLEFNKSYIKLNEFKPTDLNSELSLAFFYYKFGDLQNAAIVLNKLEQKSKNERKYITYFIVKYNQFKLGQLSGNFKYRSESNNNLIEEYSNIDLNEESVNLKSRTDYNLLRYISQEHFFDKQFQIISELSRAINNQYLSQLYGGLSSKDDCEKMICEYRRLERFLGLNYIIFDQFYNFEYLFEIVLEGIIASYAIKPGRGNRFLGFSAYWIGQIIFNGNKDNLLRLLFKYKIKNVDCNDKESASKYFIEISNNFFQNEEPSLNNLADVENRFFVDNYFKFFSNILLIASVTNFTKEVVNQFAIDLLSFIKRGFSFKRPIFEDLRLFFIRKGNIINSELLYKFLENILNSNNLNNFDLIVSIINSFEDGELGHISEDLFESILIWSDKENISARNSGWYILIILFNKLHFSNKKKLLRIIHKRLNNKLDIEFYSFTLAMDIIKFDRKKLILLLENFNWRGGNQSLKSILFGKEEFRDLELDLLINLVFKFNVKLDKVLKDKISNYNNYYDWLLNMESFNYDLFNPEWVLDLKSKYFRKEMSKSKKLREILLKNYIKSSADDLNAVLINISNHSNFEKLEG